VSRHDQDGSAAHAGGQRTGRAPNGVVADGTRRGGFIGFDTLCHLGPIYLATGIFVVGALVALPGIIAQSRS